MINLTRRGLLGGLFASGFAPAYVSSGILMPVRSFERWFPFTGGERIVMPGDQRNATVSRRGERGNIKLPPYFPTETATFRGVLWDGKAYRFA